MNKELKKLLDEAEVMLSFLDKSHIKWVKAHIKIAYFRGSVNALQELKINTTN